MPSLLLAPLRHHLLGQSEQLLRQRQQHRRLAGSGLADDQQASSADLVDIVKLFDRKSAIPITFESDEEGGPAKRCRLFNKTYQRQPSQR